MNKSKDKLPNEIYKKLLFTYDKIPISFVVGGYDFTSLKDALKFKRLAKNLEDEEIKIKYYPVGIPRFVNMEKINKETDVLVFYDET